MRSGWDWRVGREERGVQKLCEEEGVFGDPFYYPGDRTFGINVGKNHANE